MENRRRRLIPVNGLKNAEANLPTEENSTEAQAWVSGQDEHPERTGCPEGKAPEGTEEAGCGMIAVKTFWAEEG